MHKRRACEATKVVQSTGHKEFLASTAMNCVKIFTGIDADAAPSGFGQYQSPSRDCFSVTRTRDQKLDSRRAHGQTDIFACYSLKTLVLLAVCTVRTTAEHDDCRRRGPMHGMCDY